MPLQSIGSGEMTFITRDEIVEYLNKILHDDEEIIKSFSELAGDIMRDKNPPGVKTNIGSLRVMEAPGRAEYLLQIVEDMKIKTGKIRDILKEIENAKGGNIQQATKYILCVRDGVPTRLILDSSFVTRDKFKFETRLTVRTHN